MKESVNIPCFICGSEDSSLFTNIRYPDLNYPGTFSVRRCGRCGLLFNSPRLSLEEISRLYETNYYFFNRRDDVEFDRIVNLYQRTVRLVENDVASKSVLEIGCAKGYLLALLRRLGWRTRGIELSPEAADFARRKFSLDVFTGTLENYSKQHPQEKFSVILLLDVIEHLPSPDTVLNQVTDLLTDSGLLIINTPNGDSVNRLQMADRWPGFNPYHIFIFNRDNLGRLLRRHHLNSRKIFSYANAPKTAAPAAADTRSGSGRLKQAVKKCLVHPALYRLLCGGAQKALAPLLRRRALAAAARKARHAASYFDTPDASGPWAADVQGDKLVIIAAPDRPR